MVSERGLAVLRAIVEDYVATREPVGSKGIVERHAFGVSAATIRHDMALLEEEELIQAPHTSSGRIPTDKGYRAFVDQLSDIRPLTLAQRHIIETFLGEARDLDTLLARTVRLVAQLTNQLAVVQYPTFSHARVHHLDLILLAPTLVVCVLISDSGQVEQRRIEPDEPITDDVLASLRERLNEQVTGCTMAEAAAELSSSPPIDPRHFSLVQSLAATLGEQATVSQGERLMVAGAANLVRTEQDFAGSILGIIEAIEEQVVLLKLFSEMATDGDGVVVRIGHENAPFGLGEASIVSTGFGVPGRDTSRLGIIGPTRMDYSGGMAAVRAVARHVSRTLSEG
ncbi:MAG: heat-inducible transcriptional repressor HrcA [Candidatus Lumbricidophila eiseniae]|uniref:Heat-inducible transcription repressor HrcA n=1 Tax=Candidatus Lumbricidiphila eiseniae TaxID=1969409 RepID=A0A2A6FS69_9MICO|nr:MAG: heat-inducible transcriptional repressor HrcA [Candidatus Lumbricidophila eiseniae]